MLLKVMFWLHFIKIIDKKIILFFYIIFRNLTRLSIWEIEKLEKVYKNQENHVYFISKNWNRSSKIQKKENNHILITNKRIEFSESHNLNNFSVINSHFFFIEKRNQYIALLMCQWIAYN